jgi:hypothetical protein
VHCTGLRATCSWSELAYRRLRNFGCRRGRDYEARSQKPEARSGEIQPGGLTELLLSVYSCSAWCLVLALVLAVAVSSAPRRLRDTGARSQKLEARSQKPEARSGTQPGARRPD